MKEKIIGIDLGTTNSVVAIHEGGETRVLVNKDGSRITASVVAFQKNGERLVGQAARRQAVTNPRNTVFSIKRFMGRRHNEVSQEEKMVPYHVAGGSSDLVKVEVDGKDYTPPEISAMILQSLKETAEAQLGQSVNKAVLTVPAYFNDAQRQATKDAGKIAGLEVMRIINEPTAAALAYGLDKEKADETVAVFDLGGGTFDVSILEIAEGVFEVKSTSGDTHLGGDDFDEVLIHAIADQFQKEQGIDLRQDQMALQRLKEAAEKAKCELSTQMSTDVSLPFITADQSGPKHLQMTVTRAMFEKQIDDLLDRLRGPCQRALKDAGLDRSGIDEVIMVGGSTRVPAVHAVAKEIFGRDPNLTVNPDEVVACGAAIQGAVLAGDQDEIVLLDVTPLTLGIETAGGVMTPLAERNTTIPCERKQVFSTVAPNQPQVEIHVLQGERTRAIDNRTLGTFTLDGIPPAPAGMPQIEVAFNIDANGIVKVSAKDLGTGREQKITINNSSGLTEEEIDRMRKEAEIHAEDDRRFREIADKKVECDRTIYQTEKYLEDYGDRLSEEDKNAVTSAMEELKKVKDTEDVSAMTTAIDVLTKANQKFAEEIYKSQQEEQQAGDAPPPPSEGQGNADAPDGDVIDAEFEVKE